MQGITTCEIGRVRIQWHGNSSFGRWKNPALEMQLQRELNIRMGKSQGRQTEEGACWQSDGQPSPSTYTTFLLSTTLAS